MVTAMLKGNVLVAQGGGPTPVINCSLAGVLEEARHAKAIKKVLGAIHGVEGILAENTIDVSGTSEMIRRKLCRTPGAFLGSCRRKLVDEDYEKILSVFRKNDVRYFFYIGGNDSMDSADKINKLAEREHYDLEVVGIPKTIDNDLPCTDHCPGYGSAARYIASITHEVGIDIESLPPPITVIETMGRNTGWIAAAAALAKQSDDDAPHLIYVPERTVRDEKALADIEAVYRRLKRAVIVVSEGVKNEQGEYWGGIQSAATVDGFGHKLPGGAASYLAGLISASMKVRARNEKPGLCGRSSVAYASAVDQEEAFAVGRQAVRLAVKGKSGVMVTIERRRGTAYKSSLGEIELGNVANAEKMLPDEYISAEGNFVTGKFVDYCRPLIGGDLTRYIRLGDLKKTGGLRKS